MWPGGYHGFELSVPTASLSIDAVAARRRWLLRTLAKVTMWKAERSRASASQRSVTTTRRFLALPAGVRFDATGFALPLSETEMVTPVTWRTAN